MASSVATRGCDPLLVGPIKHCSLPVGILVSLGTTGHGFGPVVLTPEGVMRVRIVSLAAAGSNEGAVSPGATLGMVTDAFGGGSSCRAKHGTGSFAMGAVREPIPRFVLQAGHSAGDFGVRPSLTEQARAGRARSAKEPLGP